MKAVTDGYVPNLPALSIAVPPSFIASVAKGSGSKDKSTFVAWISDILEKLFPKNLIVSVVLSS